MIFASIGVLLVEKRLAAWVDKKFACDKTFEVEILEI